MTLSILIAGATGSIGRHAVAQASRHHAGSHTWRDAPSSHAARSTGWIVGG